MRRAWQEHLAGGSAEAERAEFDQLAQDIMRMQRTNAQRGGSHRVARALHAKPTFAADRAELRFLSLPADLSHGWAESRQVYPAIVRFSNAAGTGHSDAARDLRGVALRVQVSPEQPHDLLMTNYPVSYARNARQFVAFAVAMTGDGLSRLRGAARLIETYHLRETVRMLVNVLRGQCHPVRSVASETYWGRGAMRWGPTLAVRCLLRPVPGTTAGPRRNKADPDYLTAEAAARLAGGDIRFVLCVQRYVDEVSTPIEDTSVLWSERVSPPEPVAILTLPRRELSTADIQAQLQLTEAVAFNPWNAPDEFRPLGNLNRARRAAYEASAAQRLGDRARLA